MFSKVKPALVLSLVLWLLVACDAGVPTPNIAPALAKAEQCVESTADIRKNHMSYLDVHRDDTMIQGIRTTKYSLNACISCHVDPTRADGSPVRYADKQQDHFCASCHTYVGVKLDCFQCHADRPEVMDQPNYQHKLSDKHMQIMATKPSVDDLLTVGDSQGALQ